MKNSFVLLTAFVFAVVIAPSQTQAEIRPLVEGQDYEVVSPKGTKEKEVIEFFSYACGHCYTMETFVNNFKEKNADIKIIPVPTDLGHPQWQIYVKAYYLGELLKVLDKSHTKIFHRINIEKKQISSDAELKTFFVDLGVDPARYDKALKSFALSSKIRKAKQLAKTYRISGTPTFIANQQYKLDNRSLQTIDMIEKALLDLTKQEL
jgi:thiol:disulfide interchange protein DsbA